VVSFFIFGFRICLLTLKYIVFTKCKKNIRDGFRLENLSWRLWYRQSVLQKKVEPKTSEDIDIFNSTEEKKQLTRTRSLPDLSQWSQQKMMLQNNTHSSGCMTPSKQKFSIDMDEEEEEETESEFEYEYEYEDDEEEEEMTFTKKVSSATYKPVSLLSDMLQEETTTIIENNSGLRRCQSRYSHLDQYFLDSISA
jgi:hypothetical protein